jgi:hypothetical protein
MSPPPAETQMDDLAARRRRKKAREPAARSGIGVPALGSSQEARGLLGGLITGTPDVPSASAHASCARTDEQAADSGADTSRSAFATSHRSVAAAAFARFLADHTPRHDGPEHGMAYDVQRFNELTKQMSADAHYARDGHLQLAAARSRWRERARRSAPRTRGRPLARHVFICGAVGPSDAAGAVDRT